MIDYTICIFVGFFVDKKFVVTGRFNKRDDAEETCHYLNGGLK